MTGLISKLNHVKELMKKITHLQHLTKEINKVDLILSKENNKRIPLKIN